MPTLSTVVYYLIHYDELRSMIQWKLSHRPVHERDEESEPISLRICYDLLDKTSRSFSAVIKELNPELVVPICIFYLTLRGLDTIEDDMTLPLRTKEPLLRDFYNILDEDGWTFNGNGPNEKDRELLVRFNNVIIEFKKLKPKFREIIKDITHRMGDGMADYANNSEHIQNGVNTVKDYELYCHYVAGLVGEGLTRIFVEGDLANPALLQRPDLHESMGQFLQQTNIIRDIHEDMVDKRSFWPKEVWSKYVSEFDDLFKTENEELALRCSSEMVLMALERAPDCLYYLAGIKDQSVFNFCAIPQSMAIATLDACFQNTNIFKRNVKITKGQACGLMIESSQNLKILFGAFRRYARKIHKRNDPRDPNFLKISVACGKIEQFIESVFPSQGPNVIVGGTAGADSTLSPEEASRKAREEAEAKNDVLYMGLAVLGVISIILSFMMFLAWMLGARFDLVFAQLTGRMSTDQSAKILATKGSHGEL